MSFPGFALTAHADVATTAVGTAVPGALAPIHTKTSTADAATFLLTLLDEVAADTLDRETSYDAINPGRTASPKGELKVSSWASGGGHGNFAGKFYRFKNGTISTFFTTVFDTVRGVIPGAAYTRNNFFHGHAVLDKVGSTMDFRIVFHAYEYPKNVEKQKSDLALQVEPQVAAFDDGAAGFYKRNAIWSMGTNTVYVPNYYDYLITYTGDESAFPYFPLVTAHGCVLDQEKVGEQVVTLNVFPAEGVALFLKQ